MRGQRDAKLLHALVEDAVTNRRAPAHQSVADGDEVEHFGNDARGKFFRGERELPILLVAGEGEQFIAAARRQRRDRDFAQADQFGSLEPDAARRGRADLHGEIRRAGDRERRDDDGVGKLLNRLFELHVERARAEDTVGEGDAQGAVGELPILHAVAAHFADREAGLRREVEGVDAGALDVERECVRDEQPRLFEPYRRAVGNFHERLDAFEFRRQLDGSPVEPIRR